MLRIWPECSEISKYPGSLCPPVTMSNGLLADSVLSWPEGVIHCPMFGRREPEMHWKRGIWPKLFVKMIELLGIIPGVSSKTYTLRPKYNNRPRIMFEVDCNAVLPETAMFNVAFPVLPTSSIIMQVWFPLSTACRIFFLMEFWEDCWSTKQFPVHVDVQVVVTLPNWESAVHVSCKLEPGE